MGGTTTVGLGMATSGGCGWKTRDAGFGSGLALTVGIFCDELRQHIINHFARFLRYTIFVNRTLDIHCSRGGDGGGGRPRDGTEDGRLRGDGLHGRCDAHVRHSERESDQGCARAIFTAGTSGRQI